MPIKNNYISHALVLVVGMLVAGCAAIVIGKELNWDLASYHFYNPYSLLHHRNQLDHWPMEFVHVHLAPTADFITYFFITMLQPKTAVFILGAIHGINLWLLYGISLNLFSQMPTVIYKRSLAFMLAALGLYGPTVVPGLGSFQHDALVSLFVLGFVWIFLVTLQQKFSTLRLMAAGFLLGFAVGLKLTAGIFLLSALVAICFDPSSWKIKLRDVAWLMCGVVMGMLVTSGYWFIAQWQQFQNPIFPFMNTVFHSPNFPNVSWRDARFMPSNWLQTIFFPFYFSFDGRTNDVPFRDFRFAVLYGLLLIAMWQRVSLAAREKWLVIFFVAAYIIWQCEFSIMRYAMPLEMLAPLIIFLILNALCQQAVVRDGWIFTFTVLTVIGMFPAHAVRAPWYGSHYFNVSVPAFVATDSKAMVLMPISAYALALKPRPQTYLIAYLPQQWQYSGVAFQRDNFNLSAELREQVKNYSGHFYVIASSEYLPYMTIAANRLGLQADGECAFITSDRQKISEEDIQLCPFKK